jgi:aspartate-semialdehyde dehydrogenase
MKKVGIIGSRGMVGSVLVDRMITEGDFQHADITFFSTSQAGQPAPKIAGVAPILKDANSIQDLCEMDILISCQGGDYTKEIHPKLRKNGYQGYWIDAASSLRMQDNAVIILDPINHQLIEKAVDSGIKDFVGGNCTVSLMLLALNGLVRENLVEWVSSMTYQAASGAGAQNMLELIQQMNYLGENYLAQKQQHPHMTALEMEKQLTHEMRFGDLPKENFGHPLALNLLPWIDSELENGQSREEWKGQVEANKILGTTSNPIRIDGTCVRVSAMRCHSQGLTIKFKKNVSLETINDLIKDGNQWVHFVENNKAATLKELTPSFVSGNLNIAIGRVRKMTLGDEYLNAFTVGDQLLWGAAEPLRRMMRILLPS